MSTEIKKFLNKLWFVVWKDDSPRGWILSFLFLFIFIKFIFFPTLSFVTGTQLPLAIVESCSMYHDNNLLSDYDEWWENHENKYEELNISQEEFSLFSFNKGFNKGDILFIVGADPEKLEVGDVIIFTANQRNPVIHRIIEIRQTDSGKVFSTIGDNNNGQLQFEKEITQDQLVGKAVLKVAPYVGWMKLIFYEPSKNPQERGFCTEN